MRETIVDRAYAKTLLPPRKEDGHKGDFGKLLVLGGSVGYTGAPYLAASAAVHSGCGLVYLGVPESIWAVEAAKCEGAMPAKRLCVRIEYGENEGERRVSVRPEGGFQEVDL